MNRPSTRAVGLACLLGVAAPLEAHHSLVSEFDVTRPVVVTGVVAKVEWVNPHSWIFVEVKMPDGEIAIRAVQAGSPNSLMRHGLKKGDLRPGAEVTITGYRAKDGSLKIGGHAITLPDGRVDVDLGR